MAVNLYDSQRGWSRRSGAGLRGLGSVRNRKFYALHWKGAFPPLSCSNGFSALVWFCRSTTEADRALLIEGLLRLKCREAGALGERASEFVDAYDLRCDGCEGRSTSSQAVLESEEESPEEVLERYLLPDELSDTALLVIVGDEADYRRGVGAFGRVSGVLRESTTGCEPIREPADRRVLVQATADR